MAESCTWSDLLVELQVWTRLAALALGSRNHQLVMKCTEKALEFENKATKMRKMDR